jgi:microcin C transport system ATP-binding protein
VRRPAHAAGSAERLGTDAVAGEAIARPMTALLSVEQLTVRFGAAAVVDDVSFEIATGEKFALVGESGSGKSITALSVLGLVDGATTSGAIRFAGADLLQASEPELRAVRGGEIAMIFQEPMTALNPLHTIGAQIVEVLGLHEKLGGRAARDRAVDLLAKTGIPEPGRRVDSYPHQLSGGQRQRAMIAMALACRPRLLIADEPTTALDVTIQAQILALLDALQAEMGMALLFITHDLNLVRRFTHRVGVMERGRLVECGPTRQVFAAPQHAYTKKLLASRPARLVGAIDAAAPLRVEARRLRVSFDIPLGWFRHRGFDAVREATLTLRRGETLGIVGESGSGKTTLGMALLALQPLAEGEVLLDGERVDRADRAGLRAMRRRMQVVFQDPFGSLSPRMTVGRIVGEGLELHRPDLDRAAREALVATMLDEVGLGVQSGMSDVVERYPHEFSGGQRQRIAIARAVVLRPEVLVLDEPTSALDVSVQQQVLALLADLQRRYAMSYVFISHDLAVVRAMSHRVMVMKDGAVVEEGEAEALFDAPRQPYTQALLAAAQLG